jgi:ABC-type branched-subunit amino acid transport system substrate-binding protein
MLHTLNAGKKLLVVAAVAATVAGCGGSSKSSSTASSSSSTAAAKQSFTGKPVVVSVTSFANTVLGSEAQAWAGAKAAARAINAKGGIKGHELEIQTCNNNADPNGELSCARQAVQSSAIATAGDLTLFNDKGFLTELLHGGLAAVGDSTPEPAEDELPNSYPIDFPPGGLAQCASPAIRKATGQTEIGTVIQDTPASINNGELIDAAAHKQGAGPAGKIVVNTGVTDYAPIVEQVSGLHTNLLGVIMGTPAFAAFMATGTSSGHSYDICSIDGLVNGDPLIKLASAAANFYLGGSLPPLSAAPKYPGLKLFIADMNAEESSGDSAASVTPANYTSTGLRSWLAVNVIAQIADKLPDPNSRAAFTAAIAKDKDATTNGILPPLNFTKPQGGGPFPRVFNPDAFLTKWDTTSKQFIVAPGAPIINGLNALGF